jgi:hypothetical protein
LWREGGIQVNTVAVPLFATEYRYDAGATGFDPAKHGLPPTATDSMVFDTFLKAGCPGVKRRKKGHPLFGRLRPPGRPSASLLARDF